MQTINLLIVDDHKMIIDGVRFMLELHKKEYRFVIDHAESGEEGIEKAIKNDYDFVIMDYQLPNLNGAQATKEILAHKPNLKIMALSSHDETAYIKDILKAGAKGYVLKNIDADELLKAITTILDGKNYYSNDVAIKLINVNENSSEKKKLPRVLVSDNLTPLEQTILLLISEANTSEEIADKLSISKKTIDKYRQNLLSKLQAKNTVELLIKAKKMNLIE